jgi:hypothetical protein
LIIAPLDQERKHGNTLEAVERRAVGAPAMPALPVTVSGLKPGALGLKAFTFAPRTQKLNWRALSQVRQPRSGSPDHLSLSLSPRHICSAIIPELAGGAHALLCAPLPF